MKTPVIDGDAVFGFWPARRADISLGRLLEVMRAHGIDRACAFSARAIWTDPPGGNKETIAAAREQPELIPVGVLDPRTYPACLHELDRCIDQGIRLFRVFPDRHGWRVDQAHFLRLLSALEKASLPLIISTAGISTVVRQVSGLSIPVIVLGLHYYDLGEILAALEDAPNVYVDTLRFPGPDALEIIVQQLGSERLVFATGAPLISVEAHRLGILRANIGEDAKAAILGGNLQRILSGITT